MSHKSLLIKAGLKGPLLTDVKAQPKTVKNEKVGFYTAALHLAPARLSGYEVCAGRSPGCTAACLHYAGSPVYLNVKTAARIARTKLYFEHRSLFLEILHLEIALHRKRAAKAGLHPAMRLNATSDIPWERTDPTLFTANPDIVFYDYTAILKRQLSPTRPENYHLTFSFKETNLREAEFAVNGGANLAIVFPTKNLPATYSLSGRDIPVIDGDEHDFRPADPQGVIVGLKAKGRGKHDLTGFIDRLAA